MRAFPPRLPDQPIFYPVTNEAYARQIARDWNTTSGTLAGFVTRFDVEDAYAGRFERRVVGATEHEELWVPAEQLDDFNRRIERPIEVIAAYFGVGYRGIETEGGEDARAELLALSRMGPAALDAFFTTAEARARVFLNAFFWEATDFSSDGIERAERDRVLAALNDAASRLGGASRLGIVR